MKKRECSVCGKPIKPYKKGYTKCYHCWKKSLFKKKKAIPKKKEQTTSKKKKTKRNKRIEFPLDIGELFSGIAIFVFWLIIIYLLFNHLQMMGLSNNFEDEEFKAFLSKISFFERNETKIEMYIYEDMNHMRMEQGISPLVYSPELSLLAKEWSSHMHDTGIVEHSPYPSVFGVSEIITKTPVMPFPYPILPTSEGDWYFSCMISTSNLLVAMCATEMWEKSTLHYSAIMSPSNSIVGIGVRCRMFNCKATGLFMGGFL